MRRWSILVLALTATMCANVFINGVAFLIPVLHTDRGLDLAAAGLLSALPSFGMVVTLIGWGYLVDRFGERLVLVTGSALTAGAAFGAAVTGSLAATGVFLLLGGAAAASSNTASGRLVWLMADRGWAAGAASTLVTVSQLLGAAGRIGAGRWSDRVGSRLRPVRTIAAAAALAMGALALTDWAGSPVSVAIMVAASVITVSDNGLAFTAIAEIAGPFWSGRALGTQNTSQLFAAGVAPPLFGALIGATGYPLAFVVCAIFPLAAMPVVPADPGQ